MKEKAAVQAKIRADMNSLPYKKPKYQLFKKIEQDYFEKIQLPYILKNQENLKVKRAQSRLQMKLASQHSRTPNPAHYIWEKS